MLARDRYDEGERVHTTELLEKKTLYPKVLHEMVPDEIGTATALGYGYDKTPDLL